MVVSKSLLALLFCCMVFTLILKSSMGRPQDEEVDSQSDDDDDVDSWEGDDDEDADDAANEDDEQPGGNTGSEDGDNNKADTDQQTENAPDEGDDQSGGNANSGDENSDNAGTAQQTEEEDNEIASRIDTKEPSGSNNVPTGQNKDYVERCKGKCKGRRCPLVPGQMCEKSFLNCDAFDPYTGKGYRVDNCRGERLFASDEGSCVSTGECKKRKNRMQQKKGK